MERPHPRGSPRAGRRVLRHAGARGKSPSFEAVGYTGTDPRAAGVLSVLQNGADTDIYLYGVFYIRLENIVAAAIDDSYFLFQ